MNRKNSIEIEEYEQIALAQSKRFLFSTPVKFHDKKIMQRELDFKKLEKI